MAQSGFELFGASASVVKTGEDRLYSSYSKNIYELNEDTLTVIKSATHSTYVEGVGGISSRIFMSEDSGWIYELNPNTLEAINSNWGLGSDIGGVGGTNSKLFYTEYDKDEYRELNPDNLTIIRSVSSIGYQSRGIGGTLNNLFSVDTTMAVFFEISPETLLEIREVSRPNYITNIGGTGKRLFASKSGIIIEFNPFTLSIIRTVDSSVAGDGIGGIKGITKLVISNKLAGEDSPTIIEYQGQEYMKAGI